MSSMANNLWTVTVNQYRYKLKGHSNSIYTLILVQLIAMLFTLGGVAEWGSGFGAIHLWVYVFSGELIIVFSLFWVFGKALWLPTKLYLCQDYSLVSSRLSSNISNIVLLVTFSIFAGLTSNLLEMVLKIIVYYKTDDLFILTDGLLLQSGEVLLGLGTTIMYMVVLSALGYFFGVLAQVHMALAVSVSAVFLGTLIMAPNIAEKFLGFLTAETSVLLFTLKALATAALLFGLSILLSNRLEVQR